MPVLPVLASMTVALVLLAGCAKRPVATVSQRPAPAPGPAAPAPAPAPAPEGRDPGPAPAPPPGPAPSGACPGSAAPGAGSRACAAGAAQGVSGQRRAQADLLRLRPGDGASGRRQDPGRERAVAQLQSELSAPH